MKDPRLTWTQIVLGEHVGRSRAKFALRRMRCFYCRGPGGSVDHWNPTARGGKNSLSNYRPCCRGCNVLKGAMAPEMWILRCSVDNSGVYDDFVAVVRRNPEGPWWRQEFERLIPAGYEWSSPLGASRD